MTYHVRSVKRQDLQALEAYLSIKGNIFRHEWLIAQQAAGNLDYVVAWIQEKPVGRGAILWHGYAIPELIAEFPSTPVIRSVEVLERYRGHAIGSKLVSELEHRAFSRGFTSVSLGIMPDNVHAEKLWRRFGYKDWGKGTVSTISKYEDIQGKEVICKETFVPMRKLLTEGGA